jgi:hypothetical protein
MTTMSARDTSRLGDLFPGCALTAPASIYPVTFELPETEPGTSSLETFGGPLPWGFEQDEPGRQDQV